MRGRVPACLAYEKKVVKQGVVKHWRTGHSAGVGAAQARLAGNRQPTRQAVLACAAAHAAVLLPKFVA